MPDKSIGDTVSINYRGMLVAMLEEAATISVHTMWTDSSSLDLMCEIFVDSAGVGASITVIKRLRKAKSSPWGCAAALTVAATLEGRLQKLANESHS